MRLHVLIPTLTLALAICSGCVEENGEDGDKEDRYQLSFKIELTVSNLTEYTIIMPLPTGWEELVDQMEILEGDCIIKKSNINDTEAIEITGEESIILSNEKIINERVQVGYLDYEENKTILAYCIKTPSSGYAYIEIHFQDRNIPNHGSSDTHVYGELRNGWQYIALEGSTS